MQWLLFAAFALVLAVMYLSIRRQWLPPGITAGVGLVLSMFLMTLFSLAQNNMAIQAIVVGILVGGLFSGATLAAAWYFHNNEMKAQYVNEAQEEFYNDYNEEQY